MATARRKAPKAPARGVEFWEMDDRPSVKWATFPARHSWMNVSSPSRYWARLSGNSLVFGSGGDRYEQFAPPVDRGEIRFPLDSLGRIVRRVIKRSERARIPNKGTFSLSLSGAGPLSFTTNCGQTHLVDPQHLLEVIEDAEGILASKEKKKS